MSIQSRYCFYCSYCIVTFGCGVEFKRITVNFVIVKFPRGVFLYCHLQLEQIVRTKTVLFYFTFLISLQDNYI